MTLIVRKLPRLFSTFAVQNSSALQSAPCNISSTQVVFVLGAPGAGKSTQSSRLVSEFGYAHFSAGALIRDLIREGGDLSSKLATIVNDGQIIPSHVTVGLLQKALQPLGNTICLVDGLPRDIDNWTVWREQLQDVTVSLLQKALQPMGNALCLVDGFPRNIDNWMAWREQLQIAPHMTLILSAPEQILRERLMSRRGNRADDAEAVVGKRFKTYIESSVPVEEELACISPTVRIDASGSVDEVYAQVRQAMLEHNRACASASS